MIYIIAAAGVAWLTLTLLRLSAPYGWQDREGFHFGVDRGGRMPAHKGRKA